MTAKQKYNLSETPMCVLAAGPQETDADGGFEYVVCFGNDDGEPITENLKAIWKLWDYDETWKFAHELAGQHRLECVFECVRA